MTLDEYIENRSLTVDAKSIGARTDGIDNTWGAGARHFHVELYSSATKKRHYFTCQFSQGSAHKRLPTARDLLACLRWDFATFLANVGGFEDWCAELGFDADSRRAEFIYREVGRQVSAYRKVFGQEALDELINCEEE